MKTESGLGRKSLGHRYAPWLLAAVCGLLAVHGARAAAFSIERVSVDSSEAEGINASYNSDISSDARFVAFESNAATLVAGDTNLATDIFVRDRQLGTTERVSVDSNERQVDFGSHVPCISGDGRYVAFGSYATNLVAGDTNSSSDIFVRDRTLGTTERVSLNFGDAQSNFDSVAPSISETGFHVSFSTAAPLDERDMNATDDIYVRDLSLGTTELVSVSSSEVQGNNQSVFSSLDESGTFVAFETNSSNLVAGDTNGTSDVFVRNRTLGTTTLASGDSSGVPGNGQSFQPSMSDNGKHVAFSSAASNLVAGDTNSAFDVFVRDLTDDVTRRVSVDGSGGQGNGQSFAPSLGKGGLIAAFWSLASNLVAGDTNGSADVFVRDAALGTTMRLSKASSGAQGSADSSYPSLDAAGEYVAFESFATNLITGDTNGSSDVFVAANAPIDTAPPACRMGAVVSNPLVGLVYLPVTVTDSGSGVARVRLMMSLSTNCHLEYPLGTPVPGNDLVLSPTQSPITVYAVKNNPALRSRILLMVVDGAGNVADCDPIIANLEIKKTQRLTRTYSRLPQIEHYITLQNGTPGLASAKLWVNGKLVSSGSVADGQVLTLDVLSYMRRGNNNTVRIAATGAVGATAVLLIGDASLAGGGHGHSAAARRLNTEFSR